MHLPSVEWRQCFPFYFTVKNCDVGIIRCHGNAVNSKSDILRPRFCTLWTITTFSKNGRSQMTKFSKHISLAQRHRHIQLIRIRKHLLAVKIHRSAKLKMAHFQPRTIYGPGKTPVSSDENSVWDTEIFTGVLNLSKRYTSEI